MRKILFAVLSMILLIACSIPPQDVVISNENEPERLLRHVVLLNFNESASAEDIARVESAFRMLPVRIIAVHDFEWGINVSPENINRGYTHCFFLTFTSERNRDTYLEHPLHVEFGDILAPYVEEVLVVDYWADS